MTTYVLHGGETSRESAQNDLFFEKFTSLVNKPVVKIMMCYWSRPEETWEKLLDRDSQKVLNQTTKQVEFEIVKDPEHLNQKLTDYDVLYVAGGEAELIESRYEHVKNFKQNLAGKVFIGSSMGAFMASQNYVLSHDAQDNSTIHKGLGLLPINILCHWDVEPKQQIKLDLLSSTNLPILTLDEAKFSVIFQ